MVEAAMGVVGVEMVEAAGRVEEPATAAAAPVLLAALGDSTGGAGTGGTGDGSGGTGDGNGDGTGDSSSAADAAAATSDAAAATDASAAAATDAAATDAATTNAAAADNAAVDDTSVTAPPTDPSNNNNVETVNTALTNPTNAVTPDPTDPTALNNAVTQLDAIQAIATTDPRGGEVLVSPTDTGTLAPGGTVAPGPTAPVDVYINAVIVSAAQSPWDAIRRAPGVRNVIVTGGIVALGKTPIAGEIPGGGPQPAWLRLIPDLRLLNGSVIPPVVPNVIDIRIMNCPIKIEDLNP